MSVSTTSNRVKYDGNGSTVTAYTIPFPFLEITDIVVAHQADEDAAPTIVDPSTYTVTQLPDKSGGTLTTATAYPAAEKLTVYRATEKTQPTEYQTSGPFPAASAEESHDRQVMQLQDVSEEVGRAFKVDVGQGAVAAASGDKTNSTVGYAAGVPALRSDADLAEDLAIAADPAVNSRVAVLETDVAAIEADLTPWPIDEKSSDYTITASDRNKLIRSIGEGAVTITVDGIGVGEFLVIERGGWGPCTITTATDTLYLPGPGTGQLDARGSRCVLTSRVSGEIIASGDFEKDLIRESLSGYTILADFDADYGVIDRPADVTAGEVERWYSRQSGTVFTEPYTNRSNYHFLEKVNHDDMGNIHVQGKAGGADYSQFIRGLGTIAQPFTIACVNVRLNVNNNSIIRDDSLNHLVRCLTYNGYTMNAGVAGGGVDTNTIGGRIPDANVDGTEANNTDPSYFLGIYNGASSKTYIDTHNTFSGDCGSNSLDGSTLRFNGPERCAVKRLLIISGAINDTARGLVDQYMLEKYSTLTARP